jgi:hypothetical protein
MGLPSEDNNPQTGFVSIDGEEEGVRTHFVRLDYHVEMVAAAFSGISLATLAIIYLKIL